MAAAAPRVLQLLYEAEAVSEPGVLRWWAGRGEDRRDDGVAAIPPAVSDSPVDSMA